MLYFCCCCCCCNCTIATRVCFFYCEILARFITSRISQKMQIKTKKWTSGESDSNRKKSPMICKTAIIAFETQTLLLFVVAAIYLAEIDGFSSFVYLKLFCLNRPKNLKAKQKRQYRMTKSGMTHRYVHRGKRKKLTQTAKHGRRLLCVAQWAKDDMIQT